MEPTVPILHIEDVPQMPLQYHPGAFRAAMDAHPGSTYLRWWKAIIDPTYDDLSATQNTPAGQTKWLREEQDVRDFRAVVSGERIARQILGSGSVLSGDILVSTMTDEVPLGDHDWIIPIGRNKTLPPQAVDARTYLAKEQLRRGGVEEEIYTDGEETGRSKNSSTVRSNAGSPVLLGTGTAFLSDLYVGAAISCGGQGFVVQSVESDVRLTLDRPPNPVLAHNYLILLTEQLTYYPAYRIDAIRTQTGRFRPDVDFTLGADARSIKWLTASAPLPGERMSLEYRWLQKYVVLPELGIRRQPSEGNQIVQSILCRLWGVDLGD